MFFSPYGLDLCGAVGPAPVPALCTFPSVLQPGETGLSTQSFERLTEEDEIDWPVCAPDCTDTGGISLEEQQAGQSERASFIHVKILCANEFH